MKISSVLILALIVERESSNLATDSNSDYDGHSSFQEHYAMALSTIQHQSKTESK